MWFVGTAYETLCGLKRWISSKTHAVKYDVQGQMKKVCRNCYTLTLETGQQRTATSPYAQDLGFHA